MTRAKKKNTETQMKNHKKENQTQQQIKKKKNEKLITI